MGKVDENKQRKERNLLNTAFELFTSKGIAKTSIADIVEKAGVAKGTFYLYFRDKYDLQERLIGRKAEQLFRHALEHSGYERETEGEEQIIALIDDMLDQLSKDPALLRFINKNLSWGLFRRALDKSRGDYLAVLHQSIGAKMSDEAFRMSVYTVIELVGAACYSVILEQDPLPLEAYKPYLYRSVRAILREMREED